MQATGIPDITNEMLTMYGAFRPQWFSAVWSSARNLFALLALAEFAWAAGWLWLERRSLEEWAAGLLKQVMIIGLFYAVLLNGVDWMDTIVGSFQLMGERGAGVGSLSPGDVFLRGINIGGALLSATSAWAYITNLAGALTSVFTALITVISFALIAVSYLSTLVEAFILLTAGLIFLAFGGHHATRSYVERILGMAVAIGIKIMLFYFLVGTLLVMSAQWLETAQNLHLQPLPGNSAMAIMCGALMFLVVTWNIPKFFASLLGGQPRPTGGDTVQASASVGGMAHMAAKHMSTAVSNAIHTGNGRQQIRQ